MNEAFAYIRKAIDNAGTILVDKEGRFVFETSQRSPNGLEQLQNCLVMMAQYCGGSVHQGAVHPLTKSNATMTLDVNLRGPNNTPNPQAAAMSEFIFKSGNVFISTSMGAQTDFVLAAHSQGLPTTASVLNGYRQIEYRPDPATGQKCFYGTTLHDAVVSAIAVKLQSPSILSDQITVPHNLYNRDPVKADAVRVLLQEAALTGRGTCAIVPGKTIGDQKDALCYLVTGENAIKGFVDRSTNIDLNPHMGWAREAIEQDIKKYTRGSADPVAAAFKQETCLGDILTSLSMGKKEDFEIDGINLGSLAPR